MGDDAFWDFRTGLIASGQEIFESALHSPDSLAELSDEAIDGLLAEGFQYVAERIYRDKTGKGMPKAIYTGDYHVHKGQPWDTEEQLLAQVPKLAARFWY